jgi:hypothetical protein
MVPDQYLEDISADELSANAPVDETNANRNARRERNRKRSERRRRLRESLPICNLAEALDQVESRVHTTLKRQQLRRFTDDRRDAIKKELAKLLTVGFIREVFHFEWLANPVLVRKKNSNEWRMCVDYTNLNKHCPKDPFGLPRIDQVIDSTAGCDLLCFLDCYSGYHQIAIKEEDQEKTAFITPFGAYCYTAMSFGLKNADTTYQRAIQACFGRQLNKNVEAYVDDVVVKTRNSNTLIVDLEETFASRSVLDRC